MAALSYFLETMFLPDHSHASPGQLAKLACLDLGLGLVATAGSWLRFRRSFSLSILTPIAILFLCIASVGKCTVLNPIRAQQESLSLFFIIASSSAPICCRQTSKQWHRSHFIATSAQSIPTLVTYHTCSPMSVLRATSPITSKLRFAAARSPRFAINWTSTIGGMPNIRLRGCYPNECSSRKQKIS